MTSMNYSTWVYFIGYEPQQVISSQLTLSMAYPSGDHGTANAKNPMEMGRLVVLPGETTDTPKG